MSYIHDALKKAQKERNGRFRPYEGVSPSRPWCAGLSPKKWAAWIIGGLMIVLLAFASYSWLDLRRPFTPAGSEKAVPPPQPLKRQTDAGDFFERGRGYHRERRLEAARQWYEKALKADPGYALALNNLGVIQIQDEAYADARRNFEKAIRLKPDYVDPYYNLACFFALRGQTEESLRYLRKAVSLGPAVQKWACKDTDLSALHNLAEFKEMMGLDP
ncbi:MAG: TPR end-of-group domain-containing protein [Thermodesulfobacteriota bacterium]